LVFLGYGKGYDSTSFSIYKTEDNWNKTFVQKSSVGKTITNPHFGSPHYILPVCVCTSLLEYNTHIAFGRNYDIDVRLWNICFHMGGIYGAPVCISHGDLQQAA
jgi:hypothetical protein